MRLGAHLTAVLAINGGTTIANPVNLPRVAASADGYADIEERQTMIPNQQQRYDRMIQLGRDIANIEASVTTIWQNIQNKEPYYLQILDEIARINNYTNAEAMAKDAESYLAPGEVQALISPLEESKKKLELNLDAMRYTSGALSILSGAGIAATSKRLRIIGYGPAESYSGVWRTMIKWKYVTYSRAKVRFLRATGKMTAVEGENYLGKIIPKEARKIGNGSKGAAKARVFRYASKAMAAADFIIAIGSIIYDVVEGLKQRDEIRKAIDELATGRLAAYMELQQMNLFYSMENKILAALDIRVTQQTQINKGALCYAAADEPVAVKLAEALNAYIDGADKITEDTAYTAVTQQYDNNAVSPSWRDEDPSLDKMKQKMQEREDAAGDTETPVVPPAEYLVTGSKVTPATCNYVEFANNKGALWKLRGPYWALQAAYVEGESDTLNLFNTGVLPRGNASDFRIGLTELKRDTAATGNVYLQPTLHDGTGRTGPVVVINLSTGKLQRILTPTVTGGGSTPIQISGTATDWAGWSVQTDKLSNLVPGNSWTAWKFGLEGNDKLVLEECSLPRGWDYKGRDGKAYTGTFEFSRSSSAVDMWSGVLAATADLSTRKIDTTLYIVKPGRPPVTTEQKDSFAMTLVEPRVRWT